MRDSEMERSNVHLPVEMKEAVKERPDVTIAEACRIGLEIVARGEEFASVEQMNERDFELLSLVESEYRPVEEGLSNAAPSLAERIREARLAAAHEVARDCYERVQWAESESDERESDPSVASVGADMSPVAAVKGLLGDLDTLPDAFLIEGPENAAVQNWAEKCGMDPDEFFEFVLDELDDSQLVIDGRGTRYDERETAVATDGGGSP